MKTAIRYRGRKPKHARDPLAPRPAAMRAAAEPRIAIRLPRGVVTDLLWRWARYKRRYDAGEWRWFATVQTAMPYLERLTREYPIASELETKETWSGWLMLVNFALRVRASEFGVRVIPILSQAKYASEAGERPATDEFATEPAAAAFAVARAELERIEVPNGDL